LGLEFFPVDVPKREGTLTGPSGFFWTDNSLTIIPLRLSTEKARDRPHTFFPFSTGLWTEPAAASSPLSLLTILIGHSLVFLLRSATDYASTLPFLFSCPLLLSLRLEDRGHFFDHRRFSFVFSRQAVTPPPRLVHHSKPQPRPLIPPCSHHRSQGPHPARDVPATRQRFRLNRYRGHRSISLSGIIFFPTPTTIHPQ